VDKKIPWAWQVQAAGWAIRKIIYSKRREGNQDENMLYLQAVQSKRSVFKMS
jgi:hypothetical protein